jgi:hypothetical protein
MAMYSGKYEGMTEAYLEKRKGELFPAWGAAAEERKALEFAFIEEYFGCPDNEIPKNKRAFCKNLKFYLDTYMFDRKDADVPDGNNRWEYLFNLWKTDRDSEYSLSDCVHNENTDFETGVKRSFVEISERIEMVDEGVKKLIRLLEDKNGSLEDKIVALEAKLSEGLLSAMQAAAEEMEASE